jgi:hypothetical protein
MGREVISLTTTNADGIEHQDEHRLIERIEKLSTDAIKLLYTSMLVRVDARHKTCFVKLMKQEYYRRLAETVGLYFATYKTMLKVDTYYSRPFVDEENNRAGTDVIVDENPNYNRLSDIDRLIITLKKFTIMTTAVISFEDQETEDDDVAEVIADILEKAGKMIEHRYETSMTDERRLARLKDIRAMREDDIKNLCPVPNVDPKKHLGFIEELLADAKHDVKHAEEMENAGEWKWKQRKQAIKQYNEKYSKSIKLSFDVRKEKDEYNDEVHIDGFIATLRLNA